MQKKMPLLRNFGGVSSAVLMICLGIMFACKKPQNSEDATKKSERRVGLIKAFFGTPVQKGGDLNGFWSLTKSDVSMFRAEMHDASNVHSAHSMQGQDPGAELGYFLRIEGKNCDELFFFGDSDLTASAGTLKKLEVTADRVAYSVVFNRRNLEGYRTNQGAVLTVFNSPRRLALDFPAYRLNFNPESESAETLIKKYDLASQEIPK
ncbi:MAG: hypothetical protein U1F40_02790 [Turneriella sp.]